ncbi:MAG TPA: aminotransferase class V-fold PLP-dependent enzyme [Pseudonocardiaceae bacterium]
MPDLTPDEFRRAGHEAVEWIARYRESLEERPVRGDTAPGDVRAALPGALPEHGEPFGELLADLDRTITPGLVHWQHPSFFGYFPSNSSLASVLGDLLSGGIGVQGMLWSTGPAATELEQHLTDLLVPALGLPEAFAGAGGGGGMITESSSSANLVALLAALHRSSLNGERGDWQGHGVDRSEVVYVSAHTHSSVEKAARIAGLGTAAVRVVASDPVTAAMDPVALREAIEDDRATGRRPVMVCATVGTTSTGAVDPVRAIGEVCVERGVWLHVDAAWAGAATVCPELRHLVDGLEYADSYCTDAHKWLLTAFDCTLFWTSRPAALAEALAVVPEYLRNAASESGQVVDYRDWQVPLGRRFRALKLWAVLRHYGLEGLREHIRGHVALAAELAGRARRSAVFELAAPPCLGLVCLRVRATDPLAGDAATRAVLERVNAGGRVLLTHTVAGDRYLIRVAIGGVATERRHVDALWAELEAAARG